MLLTRELEKTSTIGLTRFYVRRAYRILPGAMLFMGAGFVIFWHELRWYQLAAVVLYLVNYDFAHPWFIGHLWSHEQFYFLWPVALKKWYRHRVWILVAALACAPMFRVVCPLAGLYGHGDKAFRPVADILAIGCLLALFSKRVPKIGGAWSGLMVIPVLLVPVYMGVLRFHTTALLLFVLWPVMHFSIAGLLLHVMQRPCRILNFGPG